ncbi:hypothetical protein ACFJGV_14475 [Cnuibacter sp. UC19_7]|uniref:hypothetical protein n=1 Tax=Cnuibacter sp. UC19_7 TaxID=3350166 RepID=UPI0036718241
MKRLIWGLYGLGVLVSLVALMSGDLGVMPKTLIVASCLFLGALLAALLNIADRVSQPAPDRTEASPLPVIHEK